MKAKENRWDLNLFRKCGLLLWLVRAQHAHYESKCARKSGGILFAFPLQKRKRNKISRFSFVIVSVRMVRFHVRFQAVKVLCSQLGIQQRRRVQSPSTGYLFARVRFGVVLSTVDGIVRFCCYQHGNLKSEKGT